MPLRLDGIECAGLIKMIEIRLLMISPRAANYAFAERVVQTVIGPLIKLTAEAFRLCRKLCA